MRLGFCSISALDRPLAAAAAMAKASGCDGIEVTARPPHLDPDGDAGAVRAAGDSVRAAGLEVVAYGSYLGRMGRLSRAEAERDVAVARALDTPLLRAWAEMPGREGGAPFAEIVALLRHAADAARDHGVTVVVERHVAAWSDTPERVEHLLAAIDRPNVALNYQVLDLLPPGEVAAQPADATRLLKYARYVHLKNYRANPQAGGPLVPGGSLAAGVLDYRAILRAVAASGYDGPMSVEFLSFDPLPLEEKLAADVAFVRRAWADAKARA